MMLQKFLWWLLYIFGETTHLPSDKPSNPLYSSEIRLWKLTGLICGYVVAVGVNVGLTLALFASTESRCDMLQSSFVYGQMKLLLMRECIFDSIASSDC